MMLQCVYSRKSDENRPFHHFRRYFTLKSSTRRLCMLRELFRTPNIAHHKQYQDGLHSQPVLRAYTMTLQCVYSRKSDENYVFRYFIRHLTLKARARWLRMLRELCKTFNMAYHNQYQCGLHSQPVLRAYTMTLQCVYSRKVTKTMFFAILSDI